MKPENYDYVVQNNVCLFQKGPLSQWWGGFRNQVGGFYDYVSNVFPPFYISEKFFVHLYNKYPKDHRIDFNCCEQYMMAAKAAVHDDIESFDKIMATYSPQEQKDFGRKVANFNPELWNEVKFVLVYNANMYKFSQNEELKKFLTSFNPHTIFAEASPWDKIWGIGMGPDDSKSLDISSWQGENLLGKVITMVRDRLLYIDTLA